MSQYNGGYYDDEEPRRYRNVQTRPRERGEPDYVREETYIERGKGSGPRDAMVFRGREDSIEDIPRDFPPPGGGRSDYRRSSYRSEYDDYSQAPRRSKSANRRYSDDYDDDRSTDYGAAGAGGAAAGYAAGRRRSGRSDRGDRRRRKDRDYDSEYSDSPPPKKDKERRKSGIEEVLGGLGLGGIAGALAGKSKDRDRSDERSVKSGRSGRSRSRVSRRRDYSSSRSSSRGTRGTRGHDDKRKTEKKWAQAAQAALITGAIEAFRSRKEPGPWTGEKGKRIATAAIGAGGIDGLLDRNPNEKTKRHLAEAVVGGLAANRLANGPRSKSRGRDRDLDDRSISPDARPRSRSRSVIDRLRGRSQSRGRSEAGEGGGGSGALKGLAVGGAAAAVGKALYDRYRSKSRKGGSRSRDSSADSYVPARNRRRGRRRSPPSDTQDTRRSVGGTGRDRSRGLGSRDINGGNNNNNGALVSAGAGAGAGGLAAGAGNRGGGGNLDQQSQMDKDKAEADGLESSDDSSTTDMENKRKHMRGKELLTAGLATIATIHAAHGVYSSMEAHEKRHKLVAEGEITPEEARKKQTKAWVQDAAAVGIAALGIKGAFSEWKEMKEHRYISPTHVLLYIYQRICRLTNRSFFTGPKSRNSKRESASDERNASNARSANRNRKRSAYRCSRRTHNSS